MASLSNIVLLPPKNGVAPNTKDITVTGTMTFDASEVGKTYRLEIKIFGEDKPDDNLPVGDAIGDDELYTFSWGFFFPKFPYKQFSVAAAGSQKFTEVRTISSDKLDEDSGSILIPSGDINTPPTSFPRKDEVYAKVSLSAVPVSDRSPTVVVGFGV